MPGASSFFYHRRIDAYTIIADHQDNCVIIVANLGFDVMRLCMLEGISQQLTANSVDLILDARTQVSPLARDGQLKCRAVCVTVNGCLQFTTSRGKQFSKINRSGVFDTQVLNSVAA